MMGLGPHLGRQYAHDLVYDVCRQVVATGRPLVDLLAEKKARNANRKRPGAIKELGEHPDGGPIHVMSGRYGPYVKWGKINATLPGDKAPEETTREEAIALIAARAGKGKSKPKKAATKVAAARPAAKATKRSGKAPARRIKVSA